METYYRLFSAIRYHYHYLYWMSDAQIDDDTYYLLHDIVLLLDNYVKH